MATFRELWGVETEHAARARLEGARVVDADVRTLEGFALRHYGPELYEIFIRGYTQKQWGKHPSELPAAILKRVPIRFTTDDRYFGDEYQGIPVAGYTAIFEELLRGSALRLSTDYFEARLYFDSLARIVVYTGPIDRFFDHRFGALEYRSLRLEHAALDMPDFQGLAQLNFADPEVPFTRVIEHKHFYGGRQPGTWITREYPAASSRDLEPMYPLRDDANCRILRQYEAMSRQMEFRKYHFGGRLAEYRYYDMHQVIASALKTVEAIASELQEPQWAAI
jgi:UDP-galactopyranose mutase